MYMRVRKCLAIKSDRKNTLSHTLNISKLALAASEGIPVAGGVVRAVTSSLIILLEELEKARANDDDAAALCEDLWALKAVISDPDVPELQDLYDDVHRELERTLSAISELNKPDRKKSKLRKLLDVSSTRALISDHRRRFENARANLTLATTSTATRISAETHNIVRETDQKLQSVSSSSNQIVNMLSDIHNRSTLAAFSFNEDGFQRIPLGSIYVRYDNEVFIRGLKTTHDWEPTNQDNYDLSITTAEIRHPSVLVSQRYTVAAFQGKGRDKAWKQAYEFASFYGRRHSNFPQLLGFVESAATHALIFHDELVPYLLHWNRLQTVVEKVELEYNTETSLDELELYLLREFHLSSVSVRDCCFVRPSTGKLVAMLPHLWEQPVGSKESRKMLQEQVGYGGVHDPKFDYMKHICLNEASNIGVASGLGMITRTRRQTTVLLAPRSVRSSSPPKINKFKLPFHSDLQCYLADIKISASLTPNSQRELHHAWFACRRKRDYDDPIEEYSICHRRDMNLLWTLTVLDNDQSSITDPFVTAAPSFGKSPPPDHVFLFVWDPLVDVDGTVYEPRWEWSTQLSSVSHEGLSEYGCTIHHDLWSTSYGLSWGQHHYDAALELTTAQTRASSPYEALEALAEISVVACDPRGRSVGYELPLSESQDSTPTKRPPTCDWFLSVFVGTRDRLRRKKVRTKFPSATHFGIYLFHCNNHERHSVSNSSGKRSPIPYKEPKCIADDPATS